MTQVEFDIWRGFFERALDGAAAVPSDAADIARHASDIAHAAAALQKKTHDEVKEES